MLSVLFIYVRSHLDLWIAMRAMMKEDEGYTPPPTLMLCQMWTALWFRECQR